MRPPIFDPPYDSPIEEKFASYAAKYFDESIDLETQIEFNTICGLFRVDFVATTPDGFVTVFEADGKEYHDEHRDEWRDAMIMGTGKVDEIYRIRGSDLIYKLDDLFYVLSVLSPQLFNERQIKNLSVLASEELTKQNISLHRDTFMASFWIDGIEELQQIRLEKRHKIIPPGMRQFWETAFRHAKSQGGGNLDLVMETYRRCRT